MFTTQNQETSGNVLSCALWGRHYSAKNDELFKREMGSDLYTYLVGTIYINAFQLCRSICNHYLA